MLLFESDSTAADFYFAAEDYLMEVIKPQEPVLMLWSTDDTVMIGANQIVKAEIDESFARSSGISIVRRPSGGGTIFTDSNTLQYTVILAYDEGLMRKDPKACMKEWLAEPLATTLEELGVNATLEGRNDVVIGGKKISGLAQHISNEYICSHGSLLFDTNLDKLVRVLTVDREKFQSKAIASVSARVTKIADHIAEKDVQVFREAFIACYARRGPLQRVSFSEDDLEAIENIRARRYRNNSWTYGREPAFTYTNKKRFPGGQVEVFLNVKRGVIQCATIKGDFLALKSVAEIEEGLAGVSHKEEALREALAHLDVASVLGSITKEELLHALI